MTAGRNRLITGLPRSGTTLTCHLLNKIENCVALHEPLSGDALTDLTGEQMASVLNSFFATERAKILERGVATSKSWRRSVPSNPRSDVYVDGTRGVMLDGREIAVLNVTRPDFQLFVKHPAMFTAGMPLLAQHFEMLAIVRNPMSVLLSWRDSGMPVADGRIPAAERLDPDLKELLDGLSEPLDRQIALLDYCFRLYTTTMGIDVLKYEMIIDTGGSALAVVAPDARLLNEPLTSRNDRNIKADSDARRIADRLLNSEGAYWRIYDRTDVERLVEAA